MSWRRQPRSHVMESHELMAGASAGVKPRLRSGRPLGAAAGSLAVVLGRLS